MKIVKYILVNETASKNTERVINNCHLPGINHHIIVNLSEYSTEALIDWLRELRFQYPSAKILKISELGEYNVTPDDSMNEIRRTLSNP